MSDPWKCQFCGTRDGSHSAECVDTGGKSYEREKSELRECKYAFEAWYKEKFGAKPSRKQDAEDYYWEFDRNRLEVWCAAWNTRATDATIAAILEEVEKWRQVGGMGADECAERIQRIINGACK